jgi:hypothetical protein
VAGALRGDAQALGTCPGDEAEHVIGGSGPGDDGGPLVDGEVPGLPGLVPAVVSRPDDQVVERSGNRFE